MSDAKLRFLTEKMEAEIVFFFSVAQEPIVLDQKNTLRLIFVNIIIIVFLFLFIDT